jgi:hypothetical protein
MYVFFTTGDILNFCEGPCIGGKFAPRDDSDMAVLEDGSPAKLW